MSPKNSPLSDSDPSESADSELAELSFSDALQRLEGILERIEDERIDIDELATELRQGASLLDLCRGKIRRAELEVTQIVQRLEGDDEGGDGGSSGDRSADQRAAGAAGDSGGKRRGTRQNDDIPF